MQKRYAEKWRMKDFKRKKGKKSIFVFIFESFKRISKAIDT